MRKSIILLVGVAAIIFLLDAALLKPTNDKEWEERFTYVSRATVLQDSVTLTNVRDWRYEPGVETDKDWIAEVTVDPSEIARVWFLLEPFPSWGAVGHTYITFEFADGSAYSFSVEARIPKGEGYSGIDGLLKNYGLAYTWGTERDFLTRRLIYLEHELRMYPLDISDEAAAAIFRALATETEILADNPRFYNTLTANCTNLLAEIVNDLYPDRLPYDLSWNFPGSSDLFLMREGLIAIEVSPEETREKHSLVPLREEITSFKDETPLTFSRMLRAALSQPE